jgi:hypothetical protein
MSNLQKIAKREMMNEYGKELTKESNNRLEKERSVSSWE